MTQTWEGRAGLPWQVFITLIAALFAWKLVSDLVTGNIWGSRTMEIIGIPLTLLLWWLVVRFYGPRTLILDKNGLTIRFGGKDQCIDWKDIALISNNPNIWGAYAATIEVYPTSDFFERNSIPKGNGRWTILSASFTRKQRREFLPLMSQYVEQTGGGFLGKTTG